MKTKKKAICNICGREVTKKTDLDFGFANGAVVGDYIKMKGHKKCVDAVDNLVVMPNRIRVHQMFHTEEI